MDEWNDHVRQYDHQGIENEDEQPKRYDRKRQGKQEKQRTNDGIEQAEDERKQDRSRNIADREPLGSQERAGDQHGSRIHRQAQ